jgi:hypothetical protein
MKLSQIDGLIFFLKLYLGKGTLNRLYFNIDLMSTFYKVKVRNNLSCVLLILTIDLVCEDQSWPSILLEIRFFTCSLSKREIDLVRGALCTREGRFFEERKRRIA